LGARRFAMAAAASPVKPPPMMAMSTWPGSRESFPWNEICQGVLPQSGEVVDMTVGCPMVKVRSRGLYLERYFTRSQTKDRVMVAPSCVVVSKESVRRSPESLKLRLMSWPMSPGKSALSRWCVT